MSDLVDHPSEGTNDWWELVDETSGDVDPFWQEGQERWYQQDYLVAMEAFQQSLMPLDLAWQEHQDQFLETSESSFDSLNDYNDASEIQERTLQLSQRLLFCAYCESDGNQVKEARKHLIMGLYLLLSNRNLRTKNTVRQTTILDDAWMELMLSFEEDPVCRTLARDVAAMAIASSKGRGGGNCGWRHRMQRPGFMAPGLSPTPFISREDHPAWCKALEEHWDLIRDEYNDIAMMRNALSVVGAGDRGSGQDDHRVVGPGSKWTEYVLFGTGSSTGDAPATKTLLQQHVPDAVSLAEQGGGEIIFSRLAPGSHIQSHCGPTNIRWTAHLGLLVPESPDCKIRVSEQWHSWQRGKILLFDDSFEHEVRNDSQEERVVLLIRLWHPYINADQRSGLLEAAKAKKDKAVEKRYAPPF